MPLSRPLVAAALGLALLMPKAGWAEEDAGAYLAARVAGSNDDYREAAVWYTRALIADPSNAALMDGAIIAQIAVGNIQGAKAVAERMRATGTDTQVALLALVAGKAKAGDFAGMLADIEAGRSVGKLMDNLTRAWAELGQGRMSEAVQEFDAIAAAPGMQVFGLYHKALALASVGDFEGAAAIMAQPEQGGFRAQRRGIIAHVQMLSQLERNEDALKVLATAFTTDVDPTIADLRARLTAGEVLPWTMARNATDGMAEVFFTLAAALNEEAEDNYTLLYARIASTLRPDHGEALLLTGALLEDLRQYDLAVETYARIPPADGGYLVAEIGRARALQSADKTEAALEVLRALSRSHDTLATVHLALGDALRREERWDEAAAAYDAAIARAGTPRPEHWAMYYSRAIANERLKRWDKAEPDFRQALALNPDQPQVLNYLGYSYLELNRNLDEALAMIQRAVELSPDSGYIIDSLAWGLFRLGRYAEAVAPMEKASLLEPVDPVVTDHLGDVYWATGRRMEARFQWRRALSFDPEEKDATRIRQKLDIGLDDVLKAEGAPSLQEVAAAEAARVPATNDN
ncbi:MAG: tetratricopeptide repeat protein [Gemmobacter sp.]